MKDPWKEKRKDFRKGVRYRCTCGWCHSPTFSNIRRELDALSEIEEYLTSADTLDTRGEASLEEALPEAERRVA
jgi:hypothetical protein